MALRYSSCCYSGQAHTHITQVQYSPLLLRHPRSSPTPSPGWCPRRWFPGEWEGEEGRWGGSCTRHPSALSLQRPNSLLYNHEGHLRSFANGPGLQHRRRGCAPAMHVTGLADTPDRSHRHLARCCLASPKSRRRSRLAPSSRWRPLPHAAQQHRLPTSTLPLGRGRGSYTDPLLLRKEPLSDE